MGRLMVSKYEGNIKGNVRVPPSKYHLHRALIFASLADGQSTITGKSDCLHIRDTLHSLSDFSIRVSKTTHGYVVHGGSYVPRNGLIRVGSSGTTSQFLLGLGSLSQGGPATFDGHRALKARPMKPLIQALTDMGLKLEAANGDRLPVTVYPGLPKGGRISIPGTLSQWISGLLILAPFASHDTIVEAIPPLNEKTYIHLTMDMMRQFGVEVSEHENGRMWTVPAGQTYRPCDIAIEPDVSSAAFLLLLAALHPCDLVLEGISDEGSHPEGRILAIIKQMGIPLEENRENNTIRIQHDGIRPAADFEVDMKDIPDLIPAMSVLAALSKGKTVMKNIGPGRLKESDRVKAMLQLNKMGADIREEGDRLIIHGKPSLHAASISTYNDHRVEMAFAIAATRAEGKTDLTFPNAYKISYPEFLGQMTQLGLDMRIRQRIKQTGRKSKKEEISL
ncbi:3-phosphoshikimate 1-carboxyvinyltransferase [Sporolactobacillus sp. THM7-7]|nr:3-phosphoshikimate 1-carboxyvinyltransferase [Sporolactobacillus sp. THM7-7]